MFKRAIDILLAIGGLALLSPLLVAVAVSIKLESPGPVLYLGRRVGRHGRPFRIAKFRSMVVDADRLGGSSTADDDPRITRVGRFLRRFKIDELPQLFNVLAGSMSLVGPRPQVAWAVGLYTPEEHQVLSVRPGITDYASLMFRNEGEILKGSSDPDRDYLEKIAPRKMLLGLEYVRCHGPWTDLKVILATALAILGIDPDWCLSAEARSIMRQKALVVKETPRTAKAA
jgi:lipopolysaccharide/colanic/teichoic acid biosynthesis glycosyltransferase